MSAAGREEVPSDEVDDRQLDLAREEGAAYQRSLEYMIEEVANTGKKKRAGDYIVAIAQEAAEGMYHLLRDGELVWKEPDDENCHIEISVCSAADQRFIPALDIEATLVSRDGETIGPFPVPFLWHPGLYHYGANVTVPGDGTYTARVVIEPARFARHDRTNGKRFANRVELEFTDIAITVGRS